MSEVIERECDRYAGRVRTDMHCHDCSKDFIGVIDFDVNGNHELICPHCGHVHCRVVTDGRITGERWDSRHGNKEICRTERIWTHNTVRAQTSSAAHFLRDRWLNRSD